MEFDTRAIHVGQEPDDHAGAAVVPIYQTSTYVYEGLGKHKGYIYSRTANPTRSALETCVASLEGAEHGFAFASGIAGEDAVFRLLNPGDHIVLATDVYGGTRRLLDHVHARFGLETTSVDNESLDAFEAAIQPNTKMVWVETPSNPLLRITDIKAVSEIAHKAGAMLIADNTFATPFLQRPLSLGADVVVHSASKYLGGHSDVIAGLVCTSNATIAEALGPLQVATGAIAGPFDSWIVLRGVKTLGLRMQRHSENAMKIAKFLTEQPSVAQVWYPGLDTHPGHELASRQMDDYGGVVAIEMKTSDDAERLVGRTKLFCLAESLGGVESLIGYPSKMSHASVSDTPYAMSDKLVRLSVGIETSSDLIKDLDAALTGA